MPCLAAHNYFFDFPPIVNASGDLVLWAGNGCSSGGDGGAALPSRNTQQNASEDKSGVVVFVARGGCPFSEKVLSIVAADGVVAVVIVDLPRSEELQAPGLGDARGVGAPVVMVAYETGARLFPERFPPLPSTQTLNTAPSELDKTSQQRFPSPALSGQVVLISATMESLRGTGRCQCAVESPEAMAEFHIIHREGCVNLHRFALVVIFLHCCLSHSRCCTLHRLKERLDIVVDEGKRALMCFTPVRTLKALQAYAHDIPPYATVSMKDKGYEVGARISLLDCLEGSWTLSPARSA